MCTRAGSRISVLAAVASARRILLQGGEMTLASVGPAGVRIDALAPAGGAERIESLAEHSAPGSGGLDEAASFASRS